MKNKFTGCRVSFSLLLTEIGRGLCLALTAGLASKCNRKLVDNLQRVVILTHKIVRIDFLRWHMIHISGFLMSGLTTIQLEMAELLVETLNLEDVSASEIVPEEALFGDGLGLDSIDALEIALAISQKYGIQMQAEDESTRDAFATLASLTEFVEQNKT